MRGGGRFAGRHVGFDAYFLGLPGRDAVEKILAPRDIPACEHGWGIPPASAWFVALSLQKASKCVALIFSRVEGFQTRQSKVATPAKGTPMNRIRPTGRALLGALVSGALATGALGGAAPAEASCFSMFGIGNGNGCTSTLTTYAIALGDGAVANAPTLFGGSLAIGKNANASTVTIGPSAFSFATAIGDNATAGGFNSLFGIALQLGPGTTATFGIGNIAVGVAEGLGNQAAVSGVFGIALQLGRGTSNAVGSLSIAAGISPFSAGSPVTSTTGFGSLALNLFGGASEGGTARVESNGFFNLAANILGNDNVVTANGPVGPGLPNWAFNVFGDRNTVAAGPGPLTLAGSIFQRDATIRQPNTGFNINGLAIPGVASVPRSAAKTAAATATAVRSTARTPTPAAAVAGKRNLNSGHERPNRAGRP
ncbi:MAG: hypothetical protein NT146_01900 [Mycobacterium sp.]|nr:hypothetical protein [Mycobacterium sp.]